MVSGISIFILGLLVFFIGLLIILALDKIFSKSEVSKNTFIILLFTFIFLLGISLLLIGLIAMAYSIILGFESLNRVLSSFLFSMTEWFYTNFANIGLTKNIVNLSFLGTLFLIIALLLFILQDDPSLHVKFLWMKDTPKARKYATASLIIFGILCLLPLFTKVIDLLFGTSLGKFGESASERLIYFSPFFEMLSNSWNLIVFYFWAIMSIIFTINAIISSKKDKDELVGGLIFLLLLSLYPLYLIYTGQIDQLYKPLIQLYHAIFG